MQRKPAVLSSVISTAFDCDRDSDLLIDYFNEDSLVNANARVIVRNAILSALLMRSLAFAHITHNQY